LSPDCEADAALLEAELDAPPEATERETEFEEPAVPERVALVAEPEAAELASDVTGDVAVPDGALVAPLLVAPAFINH
jgi:hypothetical protein